MAVRTSTTCRQAPQFEMHCEGHQKKAWVLVTAGAAGSVCSRAQTPIWCMHQHGSIPCKLLCCTTAVMSAPAVTSTMRRQCRRFACPHSTPVVPQCMSMLMSIVCRRVALFHLLRPSQCRLEAQDAPAPSVHARRSLSIRGTHASLLSSPRPVP